LLPAVVCWLLSLKSLRQDTLCFPLFPQQFRQGSRYKESQTANDPRCDAHTPEKEIAVYIRAHVAVSRSEDTYIKEIKAGSKEIEISTASEITIMRSSIIDREFHCQIFKFSD